MSEGRRANKLVVHDNGCVVLLTLSKEGQVMGRKIIVRLVYADKAMHAALVAATRAELVKRGELEEE